MSRESRSPEPDRALSSDSIPMSRLLSMVTERKVVVVIAAAVTFAIVALGVILLPRVYTASATVLVKMGREFSFRPAGDAAAPRFSLEEMVNSEVEILRSHELVGRVIEEIGVRELFPELHEKDPVNAPRRAVPAFAERLEVVAMASSSVIKVTFDHESPELAARALNVLLDRLKDKHLEIFAESEVVFLAEQLEVSRRELEAAEQARDEFSREASIHDPELERRILLERRGTLESERLLTEREIEGLRRRLEAFPASSTSVPAVDPGERKALLVARRAAVFATLEELRPRSPSGASAGLETVEGAMESSAMPTVSTTPSRFLEEARVRRLDLELKRAALLEKYDASTRPVEAVDEELRLLDRLVASGGSGDPDNLPRQLDALERELARLDEEIARLSGDELRVALEPFVTRSGLLAAQLLQIDAGLASLGSRASRLRALDREVISAEQSFVSMLRRYQDARASDASNRERLVSVRVTDPAVPPLRARGASVPVRLAIGALVGVAAGVLAALSLGLLEHRRSPRRSVRETEHRSD